MDSEIIMEDIQSIIDVCHILISSIHKDGNSAI